MDVVLPSVCVVTTIWLKWWLQNNLELTFSLSFCPVRTLPLWFVVWKVVSELQEGAPGVSSGRVRAGGWFWGGLGSAECFALYLCLDSHDIALPVAKMDIAQGQWITVCLFGIIALRWNLLVHTGSSTESPTTRSGCDQSVRIEYRMIDIDDANSC